MKISIYNHVLGIEETDHTTLMKDAGLYPGIGFSGIAIDEDCIPIVLDKCGNYGYLDANVYLVRFDILAK